MSNMTSNSAAQFADAIECHGFLLVVERRSALPSNVATQVSAMVNANAESASNIIDPPMRSEGLFPTTPEVIVIDLRWTTPIALTHAAPCSVR